MKLSEIEKDSIYLNSIIENLPQLVYWKDQNRIYRVIVKSGVWNIRRPSCLIVH